MRSAEAAVALFDFPCASGGSATGDFDNDGWPGPRDRRTRRRPRAGRGRRVADRRRHRRRVDQRDLLRPAARAVSTRRTRPSGLDAPSSSARTHRASTTRPRRTTTFGFALAAGNFDGRAATTSRSASPARTPTPVPSRSSTPQPARPLRHPQRLIGLSQGINKLHQPGHGRRRRHGRERRPVRLRARRRGRERGRHTTTSSIGAPREDVGYQARTPARST